MASIYAIAAIAVPVAWCRGQRGHAVGQVAA
jgi:hypothetical protein